MHISITNSRGGVAVILAGYFPLLRQERASLFSYFSILFYFFIHVFIYFFWTSQRRCKMRSFTPQVAIICHRPQWRYRGVSLATPLFSASPPVANHQLWEGPEKEESVEKAEEKAGREALTAAASAAAVDDDEVPAMWQLQDETETDTDTDTMGWKGGLMCVCVPQQYPPTHTDTFVIMGKQQHKRQPMTMTRQIARKTSQMSAGGCPS